MSLITLSAEASFLVLSLQLLTITALLLVFKPLLSGLLHAALLLIKSRKTLEQRIAKNKSVGRKLLRRMANEQVISQPNLAAELRLLAGRD